MATPIEEVKEAAEPEGEVDTPKAEEPVIEEVKEEPTPEVKVAAKEETAAEEVVAEKTEEQEEVKEETVVEAAVEEEAKEEEKTKDSEEEETTVLDKEEETKGEAEEALPSLVEPEPEQEIDPLEYAGGRFMLLERLFRFLSTKDIPLNPVLSGYFNKLMTLLFNRK